MDIQGPLGRLPAFTAFEVAPVLAGRRDGASVQLDETYLDGCASVLAALGDGTDAVRERFVDSREALTGAVAETERRVDAVEEEALLDASARLASAAADFPVVEWFADAFDGRVVAVPEWNRSGETLDFGVRFYFFAPDDGPDARTIYGRNVASVVADDAARFERYQGGLHGYPDCCVETFLDRESEAPERAAVEAMAGHLLVDDLPGPRTSLDEVLPGFFDDPDGDAYAWFAREFYPEPGCATAREVGRGVFEALSALVPPALVRDYYRVNFLYGVGEALRLGRPGARRPRVQALGRESVLLALPLRGLSSLERYR